MNIEIGNSIDISLIAYYLPQYYPIDENEKFWGKGFTEWTNVTKAKPIFKGHIQPKLPADLGFYDLRVSESRIAQAELAKNYGLNGFAYWHYWFGNGRQVLTRPLIEVLESGKPEFPFCISWANQSWTGRWHGLDNEIIINQQYLGKRDDSDHFHKVLPLLKDKRYIKYEGKPLIIIYKPKQHPYLDDFINHWKSLAVQNGLEGLYFLGSVEYDMTICKGLDGGILQENYFSLPKIRYFDSISRKLTGKKLTELLSLIKYGVEVHDYKSMIRRTNNLRLPNNIFPTILTGWDNTPRSGKKGVILKDYTPETFLEHVIKVRNQLNRSHNSATLCFVKSWNEWAEGNYLEPDQNNGHSFLKVIRDAFSNK